MLNSNHTEMLDKLCNEMISYFSNDAKRIQHFMKVHAFAALIGRRECLDEDTQFTLEAASYVHDCGIKPAEKKYGSCSGKLQEKEGMPVAREMLARLGFGEGVVNRVCELVGKHHTYSDIDGIDCQILIEADMIVNFYEDEVSTKGIVAFRDKYFATTAGTAILNSMYDVGT